MCLNLILVARVELNSLALVASFRIVSALNPRAPSVFVPLVEIYPVPGVAVQPFWLQSLVPGYSKVVFRSEFGIRCPLSPETARLCRCLFEERSYASPFEERSYECLVEVGLES